MERLRESSRIEQLLEALHSSRYTGGSTHTFYLYPARFSPEIARTIIERFSKPGDVVLDPFMGGGTTVIEGLAAGRYVVGTDINALAHFVATARTTPISDSDRAEILDWAARVAEDSRLVRCSDAEMQYIRNLPLGIRRFLTQARLEASTLSLPRQRDFARCVLLRLGQWVLDCRDNVTLRRDRLATKLLTLTGRMVDGMAEFVSACQSSGVRKNAITARRLLFCKKAEDIDRATLAFGRPSLVFTSPPYPGVHVLYHRWQVRGRRETPAPYWIADVPDGHCESYYTGGSRTPTGEKNYYAMIQRTFGSLRDVVAPGAVVAQLVGFSDVESQLPQYLAIMRVAGFKAIEAFGSRDGQMWRTVPNRKWHARLQGSEASSEVLLLHQAD
jgi:hypothetical protein